MVVVVVMTMTTTVAMTWTQQVSVTDHNGVDSVISHISLPGVSFGELSLMYGKPRTATVTCVHAGWLWCLERKAFRGILVDRMTHDNTVKILRKVRRGSQRTSNVEKDPWRGYLVRNSPCIVFPAGGVCLRCSR